MPSKNILRYDAEDTYYHVYSRGVNKMAVFSAEEDKDYFTYLLSRHLSIKPMVSKKGYVYPHYRGEIELLAYCVMSNHFHLMFFQNSPGALSSLMQSILTAYTVYFNKKYLRRGPLFESRYKSSPIYEEEYLLHVSRYIHRNPRSWQRYKHSSFPLIVASKEPEWLQTDRLLSQYTNLPEYIEFVKDYTTNKKIETDIGEYLANL